MGKIKSTKQYNKIIVATYSFETNSYTRFLTKYFPMWETYECEKVNDDVVFYLEKVKVFSIRIDAKNNSYKHIDFYTESAKKPYKRCFISNECIHLIRYYEFNTWHRNYDVFLEKDYKPRYTIEYFDTGERWIDWFFQPGKVFYKEEVFLDYICDQLENI